ncbi:hypothetical protein I302_108927 [Kwoniella bestiolae CBS 10118]|uniref:Uncharacterized protein n=1 Tax=Kwoniella bestiolae CBS 10118 TaxID=1296100 RepID=A0A1B9FUH7_9TREE|nr:hypothetical protein I302_08068 [Kwoniella bestiolae CBS 10118]OCF22420.1 hypothetical protein I302_08068 [Kwoniella bestiolae CBS 10118]
MTLLNSVYVVRQDLGTFKGICESLTPSGHVDKLESTAVETELYYLHTFTLSNLPEKTKRSMVDDDVSSKYDTFGMNINLENNQSQSIFNKLSKRLSFTGGEGTAAGKLVHVPTQLNSEPGDPRYQYISQKFDSKLNLKLSKYGLKKVSGEEGHNVDGVSQSCVIGRESK